MFEKYKYKVKMTKVYNNHRRLRDDVIEGYCDTKPEEKKIFVMYGPPRDSGAIRQVNTSPIVKMMETGNIIQVQTESGSIYNLEFTLQQ